MALSTREIYLVLRARDEASRIVRGFGNNLSRTGVMLQQFGSAAIASGVALTSLGAAGLAFMKSNIDIAAEYDQQARRTLTQVDGIKASLEDVAEVGRRVAREIGVPFETLQDTLFFIFSSMDVNIKEAETLLRGFAKEAVAGQTDIEAAARTSIAIMNALQIPVSELTRLQDIQFQIVRKGIISYEELSQTIGRALPATSRAGQSFETLGAMIAFMTRNGLSAAMASTSAARALEAFAHPTTVGRIEDMGIKVRDARGEFLPLVDVLGALTEEMRGMGSVERSKFMQELFKGSGGRIQARRFFDLAFANFKEFDTMVGHMENSAGAFDNAYQIMSGSVGHQSELLRNKWMLIREALGRALLPAFMKLIDFLSKILGWFERLPQSTKAFIAQFITLGSVAAIVVGSFLMFVGVMAFFVAGLILAGKALVIMMGVLAAVVLVVTAFATAIFFAWKNSTTFREIVRSVVDWFKTLWRVVVDTASGIRAAFEEHLLPPLRKLGDVISGTVLPVVLDLVAKFKEQMLPTVKSVAGFFKDTLAVAFAFIGNMIETMLIPAIQSLNNWYRENETVIDDVISRIATFAKWIGIVAVIILAGPVFAIGALIAIIAVLIFTFIAVTTVLMKVRDFLVMVGTAIFNFFAGVAETARAWAANVRDAIAGFFGWLAETWTTVWNATLDFLRGVWQGILTIIGGALNILLTTIWQPFWNVFGEFFKAIWDLIVAILRLAWTIISELFKTALLGLRIVWETTWNAISSFFSGIWNSISRFVRARWNDISRFVSSGLRGLRNIWNNIWSAVSNFVADKWRQILSAVRGPLNSIRRGISSVMGSVRRIWNSAWNAVRRVVGDRIRDAWRNVRDGIRRIRNFFTNARRWLFNAGANIIRGLIDGITSKIRDLTNTINGISQKIRDFLPGSPVKEGPLRVLNNGRAGGEIVKMIAAGMLREQPTVTKAMDDILGRTNIRDALGEITPLTRRVDLSRVGAGRGESGASKVVNQTITVNTQEIDPVAHAAQLGWLLEARS